MKIFFLSALCITCIQSFAQNVGIGTLAPTEKFEVRNALRTTVKISSESLVDTTQLIFSNTDAGDIGTSFSIKSIREEGLYFSSSSDFGPNNSANSLVILPGGNVGTGIIPTARLHVNGGIKLQGLNLFEFGAGVAGKELNAGKIGYNAFGTNALAFVGAGTNNTNRAVYFFAEGGTTFSGPATIAGNTNIGGQLQLNGSPGVAGQVLSSNGAADPTWKNTSFANNTRFSTSVPSIFNSDPLIYNTNYNLNPTDVTITSSTITINRSGLYHFEGFMEISSTWGTQAPAYQSLSTSFIADGLSYDITNSGIMDYDNASPTQWVYRKTVRFVNEIHISAPATISLSRDINFNAGGAVLLSRRISGKLSGYLISD